MNKKVTFVDSSDSFIIRSIMKDLNAAGIESGHIGLSIGAIESNKKNLGDVMVVYIDDYDSLEEGTLVFIRDISLQFNVNLFLVGEKIDIDEIKESYTFNSLAGEFYRPVNAKEVAEKLIEYLSADNQTAKNHILVVDDSGIILNTMQEWLGSRYRVSVVNSAMNAINFLEKCMPDLILLDYEMPGCSGAQLLEMLRADIRTEKIPVIFLTAKDDRESVKSVLNLSPSGYLLKNMPKDYIIEQIDNFFEKLKVNSL